MENKLGKNIRDWTVNLGFRLPNGSAPPADFFAFLTVTPHRRQLWETLMETIQPRQKVEIMRKQILVAKLQERKKHLGKGDTKQTTDRIDLWHKQKALELEVTEKKKAISKLQRNIMEKASRLLFEIYKLREMENQIKEFTEKSMVLKLLSKKENKIIQDLIRDVVKIRAPFCDSSGVEEISESVKNELFKTEECKCSLMLTNQCTLLRNINKFCETGVSEQRLWEEAIKWKKTLLSDFSDFLEDLNSIGKSLLGAKRDKMETVLNQSVAQLMQKIADKSVQAIINSVEGKQLDLEIEKLGERVLEGINCSELGNEFLISGKMNLSLGGGELAWKNIESYVNLLGHKTYLEYLKERMKKVDEETNERRRRDELNSKDGEERLQHNFKDFEAIVDEIISLQSEGKRVQEEIVRHQEKLEAVFRVQREKTDGKTNAGALQSVIEKLKDAAQKQIELLLETDLAAFRNAKTCLGKTTTEGESVSYYLRNSGGELKHFLSATLIPPSNDLQKILSEVERRKKSLGVIKTFITERGKLAAMQKKIRDQIVSIKYDSQTCERNFKECNRILWGTAYKADELLQEVDFVETILRNWAEQPYRLMVSDTFEGTSLKEYEEKYKKANNGQKF